MSAIKDAVVGISPGHSGQFQPVDLSTTGQVSSSVAIGERFSAQSDVDLVALAKHFYQTHPDNYDQLMIFTDTSVVSGNTFSYESTVANEIRGIGVDIYNSSSRLRQRRPPAQRGHDGHAVEVPRQPDRRSSSARTTR